MYKNNNQARLKSIILKLNRVDCFVAHKKII